MGGENCLDALFSRRALQPCSIKLPPGGGLDERRTEGGIFSGVVTPCSTHPTRIPTGKSHFIGCRLVVLNSSCSRGCADCERGIKFAAVFAGIDRAVARSRVV
ncbi:hypothetical protein BH09PLA1_BH09PLA1_04330 [soil metagenome]